MFDIQRVTSLKDQIDTASEILIIFDSSAKKDHLAAAAAFFLAALSLEDKQVSLLASRLPAEEFLTIPGLNSVRTDLGSRNLQISFPYSPESVDKVNYHIDEEAAKFHLTIEPQKGTEPLQSGDVQFSYIGSQADLIILVGVHQLEKLEQLYFGYEQVYDDVTTAVIHTFEPSIGMIKLDGSSFSSLSMATASLIEQLGLEITSEVATALLAGIESSTNSFGSLSTTADVFERAAQLLRAGARRLPSTKKDEQPQLQPSNQNKPDNQTSKKLKKQLNQKNNVQGFQRNQKQGNLASALSNKQSGDGGRRS